MHACRRSRRRKVWTGYEQGCVLMLATRAGLFKRLIALEDKQRAIWVKEWKPFQDNFEDITREESTAFLGERLPYNPELSAWDCEPLEVFEPRLKAAQALEKQWHEELEPPRADFPNDGPETWNFAAPVRPLKPYMPADVCETYREWALLLEKYAPQSPDPDRLQLEALVIRSMAKVARGYAGLRPWNTWDWKPAVTNLPHGKPW